ncbi:MAG: Phosphoheptose isomerase [Cryomorphaceae bacterium]|nr:MAG: Phosphoheptose isomerase [Cryomorphaceae bacterium]
MKSRIEKCMKSAAENYTSVFQNDNLKANIQQIVAKSVTAFQSDKKMLFCGNGGSASDAQHIAAELSGRFYTDRPPLYAEALHVNSSFMTAVANDYGYEATYARMVEAAGRKGDILVGISTSGNSPNVVNAIRKANELGMKTVGFTGKNGGAMKDICDIMICTPSDDTPRVQEVHILVGHIICQLIEQEMFPDA